jgi:hypothetical protein
MPIITDNSTHDKVQYINRGVQIPTGLIDESTPGKSGAFDLAKANKEGKLKFICENEDDEPLLGTPGGEAILVGNDFMGDSFILEIYNDDKTVAFSKQYFVYDQDKFAINEEKIAKNLLNRLDNKIPMQGFDKWIKFWDCIKSNFTKLDIKNILKDCKGLSCQKLFDMIENLSMNHVHVFSKEFADDPEKSPILNFNYNVKKNICDYYILFEMIYAYWIEKGRMISTLHAILSRFQNKQNPNGRNNLEQIAIDPLLPLSSALWNYSKYQKSSEYITADQRSYEYLYEYGVNITANYPVEVRNNFMNAFHKLLAEANKYYEDAKNVWITADAFPVLVALKEVHRNLKWSENNQYKGVVWESRMQMIYEQMLLGQEEIQKFMCVRPIHHDEPWIDTIDTMNMLQGLSLPSASNYRDLAECGEWILLSVRLGNWNDNTGSSTQKAQAWLNTFQDEIKKYTHAYDIVQKGMGLKVA